VSHPLIELANDREVRQAAAFRDAAARLTGESLREAFETEKANAPRMQEAGRRYFGKRSAKPPTERKKNRDVEHLGAALVRHCAESGSGVALPDDAGELMLVDAHVRVKPGRADEPETKGIGRVDAFGVLPDDRLAVVQLRYVEPTGTRCGVGDTPLHVLLQGLAYTAIAAANQSDIAGEIAERFGRQVSDAPPALVVLGSSRYWELCRKRSAQKGAAWIKELERLAPEIDAELSLPVQYLALRLQGDPGWQYDDQGAKLDAQPILVDAWEPGAGRVKPKPRPRPRASAPVDEVVEADLSRPVREYIFSELYTAGDRIDHPKLGTGVVQGIAGPGKIRVRFDEKQSVLIHGRPGTA
jgi:hypothetical protein